MRLPAYNRIPLRFLASAAIAVLVWGSVSAGWLERTIIPQLDRGLRDFYLSVTVDSRPDDAPGLLHLVFDNEALSGHGLPTRVPIAAIREMLESVRNSREAVVVDIDLATRSDIAAVRGLADYLTQWGTDPNAALLLLAYPIYEVPYRDMAAFLRLDAVVTASPNIRWAGVGTFADSDGVVRNYEYWTCVDSGADNGATALPSVALYVWAKHVSETAQQAADAVDHVMLQAGERCTQSNTDGDQVRLFDQALPQSGVIEFQTSVDALQAVRGEIGQYAPDGLPRLMTLSYCRIAPATCGAQERAAEIATMAAGRIVLVSAANDFSRDDHATPVGFLSGSVILGNVARALINSGPPTPASRFMQLLIVLAAATIIHVVWVLVDALRARLRAVRRMPLLCKILHGILNPVVVQWLAFAAADLMILIYYYRAFPASDWNGLVGASFGATTVAAIVAFNEWWSMPWHKEREEEDT